MLNELIDSIVNAIDESTVSVCESVVSHLDKYEMILEYSENMDLLSQYVDTFDIYMESKNRERDKTPRNEISKWMEKKGYWYTGNDPNKKKKCMRMYHFLQQHEFDPSNETILVVTKPGEPPRRVKFAIDGFDSIHVKELIDRGASKNAHHEVKNDKNAFLNYYTSPSIEPDPIMIIGSKALKNKQAYSQMTHGHESGHDAQIRYNDSIGRTDEYGDRTTNVYTSDQRGKEEVDFWNKMGRPKLSDYDDNIAETDADRYAVENAMKRTKNWGKNKETKHLTGNDVDKSFIKMNKNLSRFYKYNNLPHDENGMNSSTKYRRDYAKNYVKEYFSEYFIY